MHTVIKNTTTISEYKDMKFKLQQQAADACNLHKQAYDVWPHGNISKVWIDENGILCVGYDSGQWFHYNLDSGEWW